MTNYKLTTNLIADCMALIPQNLERLNDSQDIFKFKSYDPKLIEFNNLTLYNVKEQETYSILNFNGLIDTFKVFVISHCLRTIPEFQEHSKQIKVGDLCTVELFQHYNKNLFHIYRVCKILNSNSYYETPITKDWEKPPIHKEIAEIAFVMDIAVSNKILRVRTDQIKPRRTISSATLHGQGEYPPSTLEELCESYKNVMKK